MNESAEIQSILNDLRRIVRVLRESSRASEREVGLTGAQLFVLRALEGERALSLNELADRTHTHQSSVSVVVKRLVDRELVARVPSASDARRVELSLTTPGRALLSSSPGAAQQRLVDGVQSLSPEKQNALAESLRDLVSAMKIVDRAPTMLFEDDSSEGEPRE